MEKMKKIKLIIDDGFTKKTTVLNLNNMMKEIEGNELQIQNKLLKKAKDVVGFDEALSNAISNVYKEYKKG